MRRKNTWASNVFASCAFLLTATFNPLFAFQDTHESEPSPLSTRSILEDNSISTLLIGINYLHTPNQLQNCVYDLEHVIDQLLTPIFGLNPNKMTIMTDYQSGTDLYPTAENIRRQIDLFVERTNKTKRGFLQYSGHGSYLRDLNGDERDHRDEVLCPIDCNKGFFIKDDELFERIVKRLNPDVKLFFLCDCCFSGTILDLPYTYDKNGKMTRDHKMSKVALFQLPDIVVISGSTDYQTSADGAVIAGETHGSGAMTAAFLETLRRFGPQISYLTLIREMNAWLKSQGFTQNPLLSSTYKLHLSKECFEDYLPSSVLYPAY